MNKIVLFNSSTSKADLIGNVNPIMFLDDYALDVKIKKNIDSNHMLSLTLDADLLDYMVNNIPRNGIIKTYAQNSYEYWVIVEIDKNLTTIELTCRHWVTETLRSMYIIDSKPRNLNSLAMLDWIKVNSEEYKSSKQYAKDLEVEGNITTLVSMNVWHDNLYNTVADLQERYGCEVKKNGFKIGLVDQVGSKSTKYSVIYGQNLIETNAEEYISIVKGILPKGFDKLYGNIVYSEKLTNNPNMLGEIIEKEYQVRVREEDEEDEEGYTYYDTEEEAKLELRRLARLEFSVNKVDEPILTFDTTFIDLATLEEFKEDSKVWLDIGDKIYTSVPNYNIDIITRIIEMEIDVLADEVTNITLSNNDIKNIKPPTLNSVIEEVKKLPSINDIFEMAKESSLNTILGGFGANIYYTPNLIAIMDTNDYRTARNCIVANSNGWFFSRGGINPTLSETTMIADVNGNFNASVITTGTLNADLIKAGTLKSFNNKSWINMENGTFNFADKFKYDGTNFTLLIADKDLQSSTVISNITTNISDLNTNVGNLGTEINNLETDIGSLETDINGIETNVGNLDTKVNSKAKVFTTTPTVPYNLGDLWVAGATGDIMRCKTARASGNYTSTDWERASKYTDDTTANNVATTVTALTTRVASAESSITTANNNINLKASKEEVNTAIASVEIGGRNLVLNSKENYLETTENKTIPFELSDDFTTLVRGKQITLSAYMEGKWTNEDDYIYYGVDICLYFADGTEHWIGVNRGNFEEVLNEDGSVSIIGRRYSNVEVVPDKEITKMANVTYFVRNSSSLINFTIKDVKIEVGNKATDWTLAPEDVEASINSAITSIEIGGRNLVEMENIHYYNTTSFEKDKYTVITQVDSNFGGIELYNLRDVMELNKQYIYQCRFRKLEGTLINISFYNSEQFQIKEFLVDGIKRSISSNADMGINNNLWHTFTLIFTRVTDVEGDGSGDANGITIQPNRSFTNSVKIEANNFKLEKGTKATDWTPSPEDIDNAIGDVYDYITTVSSEQVEQFQSSLELTANSITSSVSETYATKTDTTEEINRLSTTIQETTKDVNLKFTKEREYTEQVEGELQSFKNTVESNINFSANGMTISSNNSPFASKFTATKLSFTQDDNEVAYISNNKMYNTDVEIKNSLVIGSFAFLPRQNGNLSIVWKEG